MGSQALGLIETFGYTGAVEAVDICLKAADVKLTVFELVTGGLVTVGVTGDVGAVKASVEAASAAVDKVGRLVSTHVIARPEEDVMMLLTGIYEKAGEGKEAMTVETLETDEKSIGTVRERFPAFSHPDELNNLKVVELRTLARKLDGINMKRSHIKYATRKELIQAIVEYYERKL